jgi:hypothetical protein
MATTATAKLGVLLESNNGSNNLQGSKNSAETVGVK